MNESLSTVDGRTVLRMERWFRHPQEKVWRAITEPSELRHWFPAIVHLDLEAGGAIRFTFENGEAPDLEGRILELDPPRLFSFHWGDSALRFELRSEACDGAPGCRLLFSHTFDDRVSAASYAAGWQICFDNMYLLMDGKPADVGLDQWASLHDGYVEQFGLGAGSAEGGPEAGGAEAGGGWEVRFERQLTRPIDEVWEVVSDGMMVAVGEPAPAGSVTGLRSPAEPASVTAAEPPRVLEVSWQVGGVEAGRVRWSLTPGNGGARLLLTQTVPAAQPEIVARALDGWFEALQALAAELRA